MNNVIISNFYPEMQGCLLHPQQSALCYPLDFAPLPSLVIFSTAFCIVTVFTVYFRQVHAVSACTVVLNP